jgi:uncharacterized damage-inducible protein DinB
MKTQSALTLLESLEDQVEQHLRDAIKIFQNLSEEELLRPADNGGWSIAQCLWHLNSYGDYYLPQIESGLTKRYPANGEFKSTWLGSYFTNMMKPGPKMKKFSAFKNHVPPAALHAHAVVAEFIQQQEKLLALLKTAKKTDLNRVRIPISIMKWIKLKLGDVFQFVIAHDERHLQQAKRNLKSSQV